MKPYQSRATALLLEWLGSHVGWGRFVDDVDDVDALTLDLQGHRAQFAVLHRSQATTAIVASATHRLTEYVAQVEEGALRPLLVVPYMGDTGAELCKRSEVDWLDLSGNASIKAPGVRVEVRGQPNQFKRRGRPASVFSPRSSRLVRQLLLESGGISQRDLVRATQLDEGYASRVLRTMLDEGLLVRNGGLLRFVDRLAVLDAWRAEYEFSDLVDLRKGHLSVESGEAITTLADRLSGVCEYAMTGLGAAALMTGFGNHRLVTVLVREVPDDKLLRALKLRAEERGANVWLARPKDDALFWGVQRVGNIACVPELQVYLDLKAQPERSEEASAVLREKLRRQWLV